MNLRFDSEIKQRLVSALGRVDVVVLAYVFGSRARGNPRADSDLDLAVLITAQADRRAALRDIVVAASDAFPATHLDVVLLNEAPPLLRHRVLRDGLLLFAKSEEQRVRFQVASLREYHDLEHQRKLFYDARVRALEGRPTHGRSGDFLEKARRLGALLRQTDRVQADP